MSADSMLRTTCLGGTSGEAKTCTSLISPCGVTTMLADNTPVRPAIRFSARFTPQGSGTLGLDGRTTGSCSAGSPASRIGLGVVTSAALWTTGYALLRYRHTAAGS